MFMFFSITAIKCIEGDAAMVEADVMRYARGQQSSRQKRKTRTAHQTTLLTLCKQYSPGEKTIRVFLKAIGYSIRL
ncbi:hypothetical protein DPMN_062339 [Dreissena polymorpha]|uniref:Uncharacterized protein n=1 Tax=Dreissena polymorpha TaxID=45954 RepID=A0A9D4C9H4_DREPO|nr:hypothetical protein DPMN_062296 [Dreissena polymorpha]KAH3719502.1 hypothetical protein DPMN_062339 [Dreissena polymorpha]